MPEPSLPPLPIDAEIDAMIDTEEGRAVLHGQLQARESHVVAGMIRALRRTEREIAEYDAQLDAMRSQTEQAQRPLRERAAALTEMLEQVARARRAEEPKRAAFEYVGAGVLRTRNKPGRPSVEDPDAIREWLDGAQRERYLEPVPDKFKAADFLRDLSTVAEERGIDERKIPGLKWGEDEISVKVETE